MRRSNRQPRGCRGLRQRKELHHRRCNDPERSFSADEKLFQVVAGVVLAQAAQAIPHLATGQHHLQTERQFAHVAVAQNLHAARVGRKVAANLATAFGCQRQREQPAHAQSGLLQRLQHAPGFDGNGVVGRIDMADLVHARQADQHGFAARVRNARPAMTGVAALRHDRHTSLPAGANDRRHFGCARRTHHAARRTAITPAPVTEV